MSALRPLLLPFSWLYALALRVRHAAYDGGLLKERTSPIPSITVGNIALGGTGKTPHVELVIRTLLQDRGHGMRAPLATLSRGYGRKGTEFLEVGRSDDAALVGDESLMLKRKFSGVHVFIGADRAAAVERIRHRLPDVHAIVLDDALQHRAFKSGLNIVLTTWQRPWHKDHVLPAGNLRDVPQRARQADVVIVTKCPSAPSTGTQHQWRKRLKLQPRQTLFFSGLEYDAPRSLTDSTRSVPTGPGTSALLVTGIADPAPLEAHVRTLFGTVDHLAFRDHHAFTGADLARIVARFGEPSNDLKTLVTTEKDAARLGQALVSGPLKDLPVAVIGVHATILNEPHAFEALIRSHVATHTTHR